jgi:SAM-dependent methyltransferase
MHKKIQNDILGKALKDYQLGNYTEDILTHSSLAGEDILPLPYLFRTFEEMPEIEQKALTLCHGLVLDIGCGSGSHSLILQEKDISTKSIDISKGAVETSILRGLQDVSVQDIWKLKEGQFDTILILMNGIGICGSLKKLTKFLKHLKSLLHANGQILLDSSNIIYMFEDEAGEIELPETDYYGEVIFEFEYKNKFSKPFPWVYVDFDTLCFHANKAGLHCQLAQEGTHYDYLAKLTRI